MKKELTPEQLPWEQFSEIGITRERIEKTGNLTALLSGRYTTPVLFYINSNGTKIEGEAAIRCYQVNDTWKVDLQGVSRKPKINDNLSIYGYFLTEKQKTNILDTGHAGEIIEIKGNDGNKRSVFVSLNPHTNRLVTFPADHVRAPERAIAGVEMTAKQKESYLNGEPVLLKGMRNKSGEDFEACVQFSAYEVGPVFVKPEWLKKQQASQSETKKEKQLDKKTTNVLHEGEKQPECKNKGKKI